jgi:hypothetical protein
MFFWEQGIPVFTVWGAGEVIVVPRNRSFFQQFAQTDISQIRMIIFPTACPGVKAELRVIFAQASLDCFCIKFFFTGDASVIPGTIKRLPPWHIPVHMALEMRFPEIGCVSTMITH